MPSNDIISLSNREALILATPAFRNLSINETGQLASIMQEVSVAAGEVVTREGELIDSVYIIASGTLEVTKQITINDKIGSTFLAILNPGENIGLNGASLYAKTGRRTATVTATTPCVLLKINIKEFNAFLDAHPQSLESMKAPTDLMLRMQFIKESNPFVHLSNQRIAWLATSVKTLRINAGDIIFKQNDPADNCYMIVEGTVEITSEAKDGSTKVIDTLKAGQLFGEQAIFKNAKRMSTAKATTNCDLMVLDQDTLEELKEESVGLPNSLFSQTSEYNQPIRLENIIYHQRELDDGQVITTLKNSINNQYLQINNEGWYIWQLLNGQMTVQEITQQFAEHFKRFDPQMVMKTINTMIDAGFAKVDVMQSDEDAASNKNSSEVKRLVDRFQWFYAIKNPDSKITKLYKFVGFVFFNIPVLALIALCSLAGMVLYPSVLDGTLVTIHSINHLAMTLFWIVFICMSLRLINPIAKALTIKYFNHNVPNFAVGLSFLLPVAWVDTSDLWASSRWPRTMTSLAGIIATLLVASLLSLYVYFYPDSTFAFTWSMCALLLYFITLQSFDPLLDSDGYITLQNALNTHKLRESALMGMEWRQHNLNIKNKDDYGRKQRNAYFIYYFCYVLAYFLLFYLIQDKLKHFVVIPFINGYWMYVLLAIGLLLELMIELNNLKKINQNVVVG